MIKCCVDTIQFNMLVRKQCRLNVNSNIKKSMINICLFSKKLNKYSTYSFFLLFRRC